MKRVISVILASLMLTGAACMTGCAKPAAVPPETTDGGLSLLSNGVTDYVIVRGDNAKEWETEGAVEFRRRFKELTGVELDITDDFEKTGVAERVPHEILIGETNREKDEIHIDRETLGRGGYIVKVENEKLIVAAHDSAGMTAALDFCFSQMLTLTALGGKQVKLPANLNTVLPHKNSGASAKDYIPLNYDDMKCMWLSQFDLTEIYTTGSSQRSEKQYTSYLKTILENVRNMGFNTVIVQVRPYADSMFPSEYFPMSSFVVGEYGNEMTYDPFAILLDMAHEMELSVQAWINPLRCMLTDEISSVPETYAVRQWYDDAEKRGKYVVEYDGRYYFNPAYEKVRQLIIDGVSELVANYDVDGVHMDDYFYPTTEDYFDHAAYSESKSKQNRGDFRRTLVNTLVSGIYEAIKEISADTLFGISPAGNVDNNHDNLYADVAEWCGNEGYIDYICPQVYWGFEHQTFDFKSVCRRWQSLIKANNVSLVIGMTMSKAVTGGDAYAGTGKDEWTKHKDVLKRCIEYTKELKFCTGVSVYCYQYCYNNLTGATRTETVEERQNFIPVLKEISWN